MYRTLYQQHETEITDARKEYEARINIEAALAECRRLFFENEELHENGENDATDQYILSKA